MTFYGDLKRICGALIASSGAVSSTAATWTSWVYSDGTTVTQDPRQTVNFLGLSYYYRFQ